MSRFTNILRELRDLQSRLKSVVNEIWEYKLSLSTAYHAGHTVHDFLPRRILSRERASELEFEKLIHKLNRIISSHLDSTLIVFDSDEDVKTIMNISKTIRYIHNSFAGDPPLGQTLTKLQMTLPAYSKN